MVAWMSGLVTGLQNRAQRFESASDLSFQHRRLAVKAGWRLFFPACRPGTTNTLISYFDRLTLAIDKGK